MAILTPQQIALGGSELAFDPADGAGDQFLNNGAMILVVANASGSDMVVSVDSQTPCSYGFDHDVADTINDGDTEYLGPFSTARFNDVDGYVNVTYDDSTDVTVAVLQIS